MHAKSLLAQLISASWCIHNILGANSPSFVVTIGLKKKKEVTNAFSPKKKKSTNMFVAEKTLRPSFAIPLSQQKERSNLC